MTHKLLTQTRIDQLMRKDAQPDRFFVYAVVTTGIYCRPSCPSRRPRLENIRLFDRAQQAVDAGYRACLRCNPAQGERDLETSLMRDMADYIRRNSAQPLPLDRLAKEAGMSASHFQRRFKAVIGVSPKAWQASVRLSNFKGGLRKGEGILEAMEDAGYGSTGRLYAALEGTLGMTPSAYRAGGAGETIGYAVCETLLGLLLMAATERGVCAVLFGETEAALLAQLAAEFPAARLVAACNAAEPALIAWMAALSDHLAGTGPVPDLPVDLRGTAFQIRVWRFLMSVPQGDVLSYAELAQAIGSPGAVRAAASACAANRIALLVPCHRVLRSDGGLGGYRWGFARKRALIDGERAPSADMACGAKAGRA